VDLHAGLLEKAALLVAHRLAPLGVLGEDHRALDGRGRALAERHQALDQRARLDGVVGVRAEDVLEAALGDLVERPEREPRHLMPLGHRG
jgi:hypothetical protein